MLSADWSDGVRWDPIGSDGVRLGNQSYRAAGCVSFGQKWKTGAARQYFTDTIGLSTTIVACKAIEFGEKKRKIRDNMNRFCMKCYVSDKEFFNFVKSQIFCQDHKLMTLFLFQHVNDCMLQTAQCTQHAYLVHFIAFVVFLLPLLYLVYNFYNKYNITPFKVIQGYRGRYQSKDRMRLPISD